MAARSFVCRPLLFCIQLALPTLPTLPPPPRAPVCRHSSACTQVTDACQHHRGGARRPKDKAGVDCCLCVRLHANLISRAPTTTTAAAAAAASHSISLGRQVSRARACHSRGPQITRLFRCRPSRTHYDLARARVCFLRHLKALSERKIASRANKGFAQQVPAVERNNISLCLSRARACFALAYVSQW